MSSSSVLPHSSAFPECKKPPLSSSMQRQQRNLLRSLSWDWAPRQDICSCPKDKSCSSPASTRCHHLRSRLVARGKRRRFSKTFWARADYKRPMANSCLLFALLFKSNIVQRGNLRFRPNVCAAAATPAGRLSSPRYCHFENYVNWRWSCCCLLTMLA